MVSTRAGTEGSHPPSLPLALEKRAAAEADNALNPSLDAIFIVAQFAGAAHAPTLHGVVLSCNAAWREEQLWAALVRVQFGAARRTHLMHAAWKGDAERLKWLLARAAPAAQLALADKDGRTALSWAACGGSAAAVSVLVDAGAPVNAATLKKDTPLALAAARGHTDAVVALLSAPAVDVNAKDAMGDTPLIAAARKGHAGALRALLAAPGVDVNVRSKSTAPTTKNSSPQGTALILAAQVGCVECVAALLAAPGVDVDARTLNGDTALIWAAYNGHVDVVRALVSANVDVNSRNTGTTQSTPLILAAREGHAKIVAILLATRGIDVNILDAHVDNALIWAACNGHAVVVSALLETGGIRVNQINELGFTALTLAAKRAHTAVVAALLKAPSIDPNVKDSAGDTALTLAARSNHGATVLALLENANTDVNLKNASGLTALMITAERGNTTFLRDLLGARNIDISAPGPTGDTALVLATKRKHAAVVTAIRAALRARESAEKLVTPIETDAETTEGTVTTTTKLDLLLAASTVVDPRKAPPQRAAATPKTSVSKTVSSLLSTMRAPVLPQPPPLPGSRAAVGGRPDTLDTKLAKPSTACFLGRNMGAAVSPAPASTASPSSSAAHPRVLTTTHAPVNASKSVLARLTAAVVTPSRGVETPPRPLFRF